MRGCTGLGQTEKENKELAKKTAKDCNKYCL